MSDACATCGGATAPGSDRPPCLCELAPPSAWSEAPEVKTSAGHARALRCPSCGGWLDSGARRCGYCSVELAAVRCWRCFELAFSGSSHCAGCGAKLGLEGDLGPTEKRCPACRAEEPLHLVHVGDHRIEECLACGGVLVDPGTLASLTRARANDSALTAVGLSPPKATITELEVRYRSCPTCGALMTRRNFGRSSGVIVDVCTEHGVWFDADELTAVLTFVAGGGLTRKPEEDEAAKRELARRRAEALTEQAKWTRGSKDTFVIDSAAALLSAIVEALR